MGNRITSVRVKRPDGTYSNEIPISPSADKVIWKDNEHNLEEILGNVDTTKPIQNQINQKVNTVELQEYIDQELAGDVGDWLEEHVVIPSGGTVAVDDTLSISGAAADSKKVGDEVTNLKENLKQNMSLLDIINYDELSTGYYYTVSSGVLTLVENSNSIYNPTKLDVSKYKYNGYIKIITSYKGDVSQRIFGFCDSNNNVGDFYKESEIFVSANGHYEALVPVTGDYFFFSKTSTGTILIMIVPETTEKIKEIYQNFVELLNPNEYVAVNPHHYEFEYGTIHNNSSLEPSSSPSKDGFIPFRFYSAYDDYYVDFDTTKYKLLAVRYDSTNTKTDIKGWLTSSPIKFSELRESNTSFAIELRSLDDSNLNLTDVTNSTNISIMKKNILWSGAAVAYVSTTGNDATGDGTRTKPYATVGKALTMANIIILRPGTYSEPIVISNRNNIKLIIDPDRNNSDSVVFDYDYNETHGVIISNVRGLYIDGIQFAKTTSDVVCINQCTDVLVQNCVFSYSSEQNGLNLNKTDAEIICCESHHNQNDGFNMHDYGNTVFRNCSGHHNVAGDGLSHHEYCTGVVDGGEWYNNGKAGISTPTYGAIVHIYNAYCHDNVQGLQIYNGSSGPATGHADTKIMVVNCVAVENTYGITINDYAVIAINCIITENSINDVLLTNDGTITRFPAA